MKPWMTKSGDFKSCDCTRKRRISSLRAFRSAAAAPFHGNIANAAVATAVPSPLLLAECGDRAAAGNFGRAVGVNDQRRLGRDAETEPRAGNRHQPPQRGVVLRIEGGVDDGVGEPAEGGEGGGEAAHVAGVGAEA